jgi:hypothetical protein
VFEAKCLNYIKLLLYSYDFQLDQVPFQSFLDTFNSSPEPDAQYQEQQAMLIKSYLELIAQGLAQLNFAVSDVFQANAQDLVSLKAFETGLQQLNITSIPKDHIRTMVEALQSEASDSPHVDINELADLLKHYQILSHQPSSEFSEDFEASDESHAMNHEQIEEYSESYEDD